MKPSPEMINDRLIPAMWTMRNKQMRSENYTVPGFPRQSSARLFRCLIPVILVLMCRIVAMGCCGDTGSTSSSECEGYVETNIDAICANPLSGSLCPGQTVTVTLCPCADPDADLVVQFHAVPGSGSITPTSNSSTQWVFTVPDDGPPGMWEIEATAFSSGGAPFTATYTVGPSVPGTPTGTIAISPGSTCVSGVTIVTPGATISVTGTAGGNYTDCKGQSHDFTFTSPQNTQPYLWQDASDELNFSDPTQLSTTFVAPSQPCTATIQFVVTPDVPPDSPPDTTAPSTTVTQQVQFFGLNSVDTMPSGTVELAANPTITAILGYTGCPDNIPFTYQLYWFDEGLVDSGVAPQTLTGAAGTSCTFTLPKTPTRTYVITASFCTTTVYSDPVTFTTPNYSMAITHTLTDKQRWRQGMMDTATVTFTPSTPDPVSITYELHNVETKNIDFTSTTMNLSQVIPISKPGRFYILATESNTGLSAQTDNYVCWDASLQSDQFTIEWDNFKASLLEQELEQAQQLSSTYKTLIEETAKQAHEKLPKLAKEVGEEAKSMQDALDQADKKLNQAIANKTAQLQQVSAELNNPNLTDEARARLNAEATALQTSITDSSAKLDEVMTTSTKLNGALSANPATYEAVASAFEAANVLLTAYFAYKGLDELQELYQASADLNKEVANAQEIAKKFDALIKTIYSTQASRLQPPQQEFITLTSTPGGLSVITLSEFPTFKTTDPYIPMSEGDWDFTHFTLLQGNQGGWKDDMSPGTPFITPPGTTGVLKLNVDAYGNLGHDVITAFVDGDVIPGAATVTSDGFTQEELLNLVKTPIAQSEANYKSAKIGLKALIEFMAVGGAVFTGIGILGALIGALTWTAAGFVASIGAAFALAVTVVALIGLGIVAIIQHITNNIPLFDSIENNYPSSSYHFN